MPKLGFCVFDMPPEVYEGLLGAELYPYDALPGPEDQYPTDPTGENDPMVDTALTLLAPLLNGLVISFGPPEGGVKTFPKDVKGGRVVLRWNWGNGCCCLRAASPDVDKMFDPLS